MPLVLALSSALVWGAADFLGGTASRRQPAATVLLYASLLALPVMVVVALVGGDLVFDARSVGWGIVAGVSCSIGIVLLYRGLATGVMGVVAPISSTSVLVPVVIGLVRGDRPGVWTLVGIAVAIVGVVLAGGPNLREFRTGGHVPVLLALGAALGLGISLLAVADGAVSSTYATLLVMRVTYPVLLVIVVLALGLARTPVRATVPLVAASGVGDVLALVLYGVAVRSGSLPVVAALASMFPVATILLARRVHHERLSREQLVGAVIAVLGVVTVVGTSA